MFVRVVVAYNIIPTRRRSHGPRVHQDPRLVVMDTVPVSYECTINNVSSSIAFAGAILSTICVRHTKDNNMDGTYFVTRDNTL